MKYYNKQKVVEQVGKLLVTEMNVLIRIILGKIGQDSIPVDRCPLEVRYSLLVKVIVKWGS